MTKKTFRLSPKTKQKHGKYELTMQTKLGPKGKGLSVILTAMEREGYFVTVNVAQFTSKIEGKKITATWYSDHLNENYKEK